MSFMLRLLNRRCTRWSLGLVFPARCFVSGHERGRHRTKTLYVDPAGAADVVHCKFPCGQIEVFREVVVPIGAARGGPGKLVDDRTPLGLELRKRIEHVSRVTGECMSECLHV